MIDWNAWRFSGTAAFRAGATGSAVFLAGLLIFAVLRKYIVRTRLTVPALLTIILFVIHTGAIALNPDLILKEHAPDLTSLWLRRALAAGALFVFLRVLDRLLIVPVLTRGGKIPIQRFFHQVINIVIGLFAILCFGSYEFGWEIDRFLEGSAVVSIILGLALQETLGNFFSGLVMQASSPFSLGDWIICAGVEGKVVDMTWRAVTIHTPDDNHVIMPNGTIAKEQIVNFHTPTPATARTVQIGLDYDLAPGDAIAVLTTAVLETAGVIPRPEPFIYIFQFADSAITYNCKFWIADPGKHLRVEHDVRANIWYRLKEKGYGIPFPVRTVEITSQERKSRRQSIAASDQRFQAIAGLWLFAPLSEEQKREIADAAGDLILSPGQVLFRQDDSGDSLFIIRRGEVDVLVKRDGGPETKVASLKAGDFFGEMSALTGQPRTATIRAASELACVEVHKDDLRHIFESDESMMEKISRVIAERNASREAAVQEAQSAAAKEAAVSNQQKSLLGRMLSFFGGGVAGVKAGRSGD